MFHPEASITLGDSDGWLEADYDGRLPRRDAAHRPVDHARDQRTHRQPPGPHPAHAREPRSSHRRRSAGAGAGRPATGRGCTVIGGHTTTAVGGSSRSIEQPLEPPATPPRLAGGGSATETQTCSGPPTNPRVAATTVTHPPRQPGTSFPSEPFLLPGIPMREAPVVHGPSDTPRGLVLWLHGLGASGNDTTPWCPSSAAPTCVWCCPMPRYGPSPSTAVLRCGPGTTSATSSPVPTVSPSPTCASQPSCSPSCCGPTRPRPACPGSEWSSTRASARAGPWPTTWACAGPSGWPAGSPQHLSGGRGCPGRSCQLPPPHLSHCPCSWPTAPTTPPCASGAASLPWSSCRGWDCRVARVPHGPRGVHGRARRPARLAQRGAAAGMSPLSSAAGRSVGRLRCLMPRQVPRRRTARSPAAATHYAAPCPREPQNTSPTPTQDRPL